MSAKSLCVTSWSWIVAITCRRSCTPPFLALVMSFSAYGRNALALASVVTIASAANRLAARLAMISRWCAGSRPKRGPFFGVGIPAPLFLHPQRQPALVELLDDLFEALRTEVRDRQQVVFGLLHELADRVDPSALQAVARALREVELLDRQLEVRRRRRGRRHLTELEATRLVREIGDEPDERAQRVG